MKMKLALGFALFAGLLQTAAAEPFANRKQLIDYWLTQSPGVLTEVFLNGQIAVSRPGFGPAHVIQYFTCSATGDIRQVCNHFLDGATDVQTLVDLLPLETIVWNNSLLQLGGFTTIYIDTCTGGMSSLGPVLYEKVTMVDTGFGPPQQYYCY